MPKESNLQSLVELKCDENGKGYYFQGSNIKLTGKPVPIGRSTQIQFSMDSVEPNDDDFTPLGHGFFSLLEQRANAVLEERWPEANAFVAGYSKRQDISRKGSSGQESVYPMTCLYYEMIQYVRVSPRDLKRYHQALLGKSPKSQKGGAK